MERALDEKTWRGLFVMACVVQLRLLGGWAVLAEEEGVVAATMRLGMEWLGERIMFPWSPTEESAVMLGMD